MARAVEYRGHSSIIPIFDSSHNGSIPIIQIKEEVIDDDCSSGACAQDIHYDSTNDLRMDQSTSQQFIEDNNKALQPVFRRLTRRSAAAAAAAEIQALTEFEDNKKSVKGMNVNDNDNNDNHNINNNNNDNNDNNDGNNDDDNDSVKKHTNKSSVQQSEKNISEPKSKSSKRSKRGKTCEICLIHFPDEYTLKLHSNYYNSSLLRCRMCNKYFKSVYELKNHRSSVHKKIDVLSGNKLQCDYCKMVSRCKKHIQQHLLHFHYDEIFNKQVEEESEISNKIRSPTSRLSNSSLLIKERKAEKRKRTKSLSYIVNEPIIPLHSINTRLSSERKALFSIPTPDSPKNTSSLLNENQHLDNISPKKSISRTRTTINSTHPPLVQIYAIPNEVEALLSDCEDIPAKRMKLQISPNKNSKNGTAIDLNASKSTDLSTSNSHVKLNNYTGTEESSRILTLKENFNCQDCVVRLERLNLNDDIYKLINNSNENSLTDKSNETLLVKPNSEKSTSVICGTVGIELENLDIALKKLETPKSSSLLDTSLLSTNLNSTNEDTDLDNSHSSNHHEESDKEISNEILSPAKIRKIYLSSICRSRFTTQKKLIYHFLNYHGYPNYICAVCRTECSRLGELKKHLAVHCIGIPKSPDDRSPIDPKGPCESSKKKFTCKNCKKGFLTNFSLEEHTRQCQIIETKIEKSHDLSNNETVIDNVNIDENMVVNQNENDDVSLLPCSSENQLIDLETDLMENTHQPMSSSFPTSSSLPLHSSPSPPLSPSIPRPRPALPVLIPAAVEAISDDTNIIEKNYQSTYNWSQYIHSDIPRQKVSVNPNCHYKCEVCQSRFLTRENLTCHIKKFQSDEMIQCDKCKTSFPSTGLLTAHKKAAHNIDSIMYKVYCLVCDQGFSDKKNLRLHMMHIHNDELQTYTKFPDIEMEFEMTCRICDAIFKSRKKFIEHIMYYYNDRTVKCELCGDEFYGQYMFHAHTKQVHYTKDSYLSYSYSCNICADRFEYESHLRSHILHFHSHRITTPKYDINQSQRQQEQLYRCTVCDENFITQISLSQHQLEYSNNGIYKCNHCDRKCATLIFLDNHKRRCHYGHSSPNSKKCDFCSEIVLPKFYNSHLKHFHTNDDDDDNNQQILEIYEKNINETMKYPQHTDIFNTYDNQRNSDNYEPWIPSGVYSDNAIEYTCAICDMKFKFDNELKEHMKNHKTESNSDNSMISYNFTNQNFEVEPQINIGDSDDDSKYNISIANICTVELEEYDGLYNPDTTKETNTINDKLNPLIISRRNRHDYTDHNYQKNKTSEITCNEAFAVARNTQQTSLPHTHQELSNLNQPELILNNKEIVEIPQISSTTTEELNTVNDLQSQQQQKKASGTCKIQTKINQYFQKSRAENIISVLCDTCGVGFEKSSDLIQHKKRCHDELSILSKNQNSNKNIHSSLLSNDYSSSNQKNTSPEQLTITIIDNDEIDKNCTEVSCNDNLLNHSTVDNHLDDDDDLQIIESVDNSILYSRLQKK